MWADVCTDELWILPLQIHKYAPTITITSVQSRSEPENEITV